MYKVINRFTDLEDDGYKYNVGDTYPHEGYSPTPERVKLLASDKNRQKKVLIEQVVEDEPKKRKKKLNNENVSRETLKAVKTDD